MRDKHNTLNKTFLFAKQNTSMDTKIDFQKQSLPKQAKQILLGEFFTTLQRFPKPSLMKIKAVLCLSKSAPFQPVLKINLGPS